MNLKTVSLALVALASLASPAADGPSLVIRAKVDLRGVSADEALLSADGIALFLRMAPSKGLADYDLKRGNYLNFKRADGSCAVLEATIGARAARVGIPLACLDTTRPASDVTLSWQPPRWSLQVDGCVDEEFPPNAGCVAWKGGAAVRVASKRVREGSVVAEANAVEVVPAVDEGPIEKSIQYWTPKQHSAWVGDVAPGTFDGRLHVFYLIDRRHHGSGGGAGRHQFAHLVSPDLVHWRQAPLAVPIRAWWQTCGTGTPFMKDGHLALAFGWHSDRLAKGFPLGGTYATAADGEHFVNSGVMMTAAQNPSVYNRPDGLYELVTSYGGPIGIFRSKDLKDWTLFDAKLPFRGDCPSLFDWHGHRYLLQGFTRFAYSADGSAGSFVDRSNEPDAPYDGLSVPMVTPWAGDRRLYVGWLNHLYGWGGWLVFRELVAYPDGRLGLKWVREIAPPVPPEVFAKRRGKTSLRYRPAAGGADLLLTVDPATREASWRDDAPGATFEARHRANNVKVGAIREIAGVYDVKVVAYYDAKADATIFDAEIAGARTLICRRAGRYARLTDR